MARPPKPADEVRDKVLQLRLTAGERKAMEEAAAKAGESLSEFIRSAGMERAAKQGKGR